VGYAGDALKITCESNGIPIWNKEGKTNFHYKLINYYNGGEEVIELANLQSSHTGRYGCMDTETGLEEELHLYVGGNSSTKQL